MVVLDQEGGELLLSALSCQVLCLMVVHHVCAKRVKLGFYFEPWSKIISPCCSNKTHSRLQDWTKIILQTESQDGSLNLGSMRSWFLHWSSVHLSGSSPQQKQNKSLQNNFIKKPSYFKADFFVAAPSTLLTYLVKVAICLKAFLCHCDTWLDSCR